GDRTPSGASVVRRQLLGEERERAQQEEAHHDEREVFVHCCTSKIPLPRAPRQRRAPIIRAMASTRAITGAGGRALEVQVAGPDDGRVVLFHDGTPGDGTLFAPLVQDGAARGLRHVSYARPGYAGSS